MSAVWVLMSVGAQAQSLVGKVMTVNGPIAPEALGLTLPHEHLLIEVQPYADTPQAWREVGREAPSTVEEKAYYSAPLTMDKIGAALMGKLNRDNRRLDNEAQAIEEATQFKWMGGRSIVDVTSIGIARNPAALKRIADATGLNLVMGAGWHEHGYVGDAIDTRSVESLADEIVKNITVGVEGVRAGIIGELGIRDAQRPYEKKLLAAAARASAQTGAPISLHFVASRREQLAALQALKSAGADLSRVAVGHANVLAHDAALLKQILATGAYVQFDKLGDAPHILTEVPDHDVAVAIVDLIKQGYVKQILLSQDVSAKTDLKAFGGSGYAFVPEQFVPYLQRMGVTDEQIEQLTVGNPRALLTLVAARK